MKRLLCIALILAGLLCGSAMGAFGEGAFELPVQSVTLGYGDVFDLTQAVMPHSAASHVSLSSDDPSVAAVQGGKIKGVRGGTTVVTAKYGSTEKKVQVKVGAVSPKSVTLSKKALTVAPGAKGTLTAKIAPANSSYKTLVWESSDPKVAQVDQDGNVRAIGLGRTVIRVSVKDTGVSASCQVTVADIKVTKIKLAKTSVSVKHGATLALTVNVLPTTAANQTLAWSSSDETVVKVQDGTIKGVKPGKAVVTASAKDGSGVKAVCKVTVSPVAVKSVTLSKGYTSVKKGESIQLSAKVLPENASYPNVTYASSKESVATVSQDGTVHAVASGTATIRASAGGKSAVLHVLVPSDKVKAEIVISAAGDVTVGGDTRNISMYAYQFLRDSDGGYARYLKGASSLFESDDLTIVNLESAITNGKSTVSKSYILGAPTDYVKVLSSASVEAVCLANNHSMDFGAAGRSETEKTLKNAGIMPYSVGGAFMTVKGVKIGMVGFYSTSASVVKRTVSKLAPQCDILIVSFHWGNEFDYVVGASMMSMGRAAVDAGADLVLGHHQHVVSGIEVYKGKYIVYGLGTLSSILANPEDKDTFIFRQKFLVGEDGPQDGGIQVVPFSMSSSNDYNDGRCRMLSGDAAKRVKEKIRKYSAKFPVPADFN